MKGVKDQQVIDAANKVGISPRAFAKRLKKMTFEEAAATQPLTKQQAGQIGAKVTPWRHSLHLRGSKVFDK